jgi:hypothetical protein
MAGVSDQELDRNRRLFERRYFGVAQSQAVAKSMASTISEQSVRTIGRNLMGPLLEEVQALPVVEIDGADNNMKALNAFENFERGGPDDAAQSDTSSRTSSTRSNRKFKQAERNAALIKQLKKLNRLKKLKKLIREKKGKTRELNQKGLKFDEYLRLHKYLRLRKKELIGMTVTLDGQRGGDEEEFGN